MTFVQEGSLAMQWHERFKSRLKLRGASVRVFACRSKSWKSSELITTIIGFTSHCAGELRENDLANGRPPTPPLPTTPGGAIAAVCSKCRSRRNFRIRHAQGKIVCGWKSGQLNTRFASRGATSMYNREGLCVPKTSSGASRAAAKNLTQVIASGEASSTDLALTVSISRSWPSDSDAGPRVLRCEIR